MNYRSLSHCSVDTLLDSQYYLQTNILKRFGKPRVSENKISALERKLFSSGKTKLTERNICFTVALNLSRWTNGKMFDLFFDEISIEFVRRVFFVRFDTTNEKCFLQIKQRENRPSFRVEIRDESKLLSINFWENSRSKFGRKSSWSKIVALSVVDFDFRRATSMKCFRFDFRIKFVWNFQTENLGFSREIRRPNKKLRLKKKRFSSCGKAEKNWSRKPKKCRTKNWFSRQFDVEKFRWVLKVRLSERRRNRSSILPKSCEASSSWLKIPVFVSSNRSQMILLSKKSIWKTKKRKISKYLCSISFPRRTRFQPISSLSNSSWTFFRLTSRKNSSIFSFE